MKIISLPESEKSLVRKAMQQDRLAQKKLFDQYASPMLSVCRQYIKDLHFAEDVMIIGFTKVI
jgi:DNA-directed RNA polymerase specialized sigma24 family protein